MLVRPSHAPLYVFMLVCGMPYPSHGVSLSVLRYVVCSIRTMCYPQLCKRRWYGLSELCVIPNCAIVHTYVVYPIPGLPQPPPTLLYIFYFYVTLSVSMTLTNTIQYDQGQETEPEPEFVCSWSRSRKFQKWAAPATLSYPIHVSSLFLLCPSLKITHAPLLSEALSHPC